MFGSNFMGNFGIPDPSFGYQGADAQGGYLGPNAVPDPMAGGSQNAAPAPIGSPAGGLPTPQQPSPAAPSPLGAGPLSLGGAQPSQQPQQPTPEPGQAPAAGVGSPFGRP